MRRAFPGGRFRGRCDCRVKRRNSHATPARLSLRRQVGQDFRGLACVLRDDSLVQRHDCSSGFPVPRMPAAIWTIEAANPMIARASDRFRLYDAGAQRANQTDQQQNCYQPSKHASSPLQLRRRLYGPNRNTTSADGDVNPAAPVRLTRVSAFIVCAGLAIAP